MADRLLDPGPQAGPERLRRSPLAHLEDRLAPAAATDAGRGATSAVALREVPFLGMVSLRLDPASPAAARIGSYLGAPLPLHCGETSQAGPFTVLWLGPDEWLVVSDAEAPSPVRPLREALADHAGSVVDVSANRTTLELTGPAARGVLEKGCPLDLHPRTFGPGRAISTTLGPVPLILWHTAEGPPSYRLLPRCSYADYLARWLLDAMREYEDQEE